MVTHTDAGSALVKVTVHGKTDNQTRDYNHVAGTMGGQIRVLWTLGEGEKKKPMDTKEKAERRLEVTFRLALRRVGVNPETRSPWRWNSMTGVWNGKKWESEKSWWEPD